LHSRRIISIVTASGGLVLGCLLLLGGCSDESKTTGTQLQLSPEDKAKIEDMRGVMKGQKAALRQERVEDRKKAKGR